MYYAVFRWEQTQSAAIDTDFYDTDIEVYAIDKYVYAIDIHVYGIDSNAT